MAPIALGALTNDQVLKSAQRSGLRTGSSHPLDQLTPEEIKLASEAVRRYVAEKTEVKVFKFVAAALKEPPKVDVLAWLGIPTEPDSDAAPIDVAIKRQVEILLIDEIIGTAYEIVVTLTPNGSEVGDLSALPEGHQPSLTVEELFEAEKMCREHPVIVQLAKDVGVEKDQLYCDGWSIGIDSRFPACKRLQQCLLYARLSPHENLYAHPMDFTPVFDCNTKELLTIDFAAVRSKSGAISSGTTIPSEIDVTLKAQEAAGRPRIPPPMTPYDFLPDLMKQNDSAFKTRDDLKPLEIIQPEGVSFKLDGNRLSWQKWDLHVAFHHREGLVLNTVTYNDDGKIRPIMYRMSLAEMVVPYAAPEHPHPRKFAFDVGEYGLGVLANELQVGRCCKGSIAYLPGSFITHSGAPETIKHAICIHEEDDGVLWRHIDYRPGGRGANVRSRKLVINSIFTIANYEYICAWSLYLDGTMELEIRLTGILNLYVLQEGEQTHGFGTQVAPRINAHMHQHLFSLRMDPMLDGLKNSVVETEIHPMEQGVGSSENYFGNGFYARKRVLESTAEGGRLYDNQTSRQWSIVNEAKKHYASGDPVGYKIMCKDMPPLYPSPDSWVAKRAPFATKNLWVAPYGEGEVYPSGKYVVQTRETPEDSILAWTKGDRNIRNEDVALWVTFGVTHLPRPEDFPVMPVEHCRLMLKPVGFFDMNPAMDVPGDTDKHSQLVFGEVAGNGESCCSSR